MVILFILILKVEILVLIKCKNKSYAKINLGLAVTGKRADLYHELCSLFIPIGLFDVLNIEFEEAESFRCQIVADGLFSSALPLDNSNLIYRACELVSKTYNKNFNIKVTVEKNIPSGAGLGGGSSNAALILNELNFLLKLNLSNLELKKLALKLGADVPFFIDSVASLVEGIGEKITPFHIHKEYEILLIKPKESVSTSEVFKDYILDLTLNSLSANNFYHIRNLYSCGLSDTHIMSKLSNDLEGLAVRKCPEITKVKDYIKGFSPIVCMMSGSGSSVFGVFEKLSLDFGKNLCDTFYVSQLGNWFLFKTKFMRRA